MTWLQHGEDYALEHAAERAYIQQWKMRLEQRASIKPDGKIRLRKKFDPDEIAWSKEKGSAIVSGAARAEAVALIPRSPFSEERVQILYGSVESGYIPAACVDTVVYLQFATTQRVENLYKELARHDQPDENKQYRFFGVPPGDYFLITGVKPILSTAGRFRPAAGMVMRSLTVRQGDHLKIDLAPSLDEAEKDFSFLFNIEQAGPSWSEGRQKLAARFWAACSHADITGRADNNEMLSVGSQGDSCTEEHHPIAVSPATRNLNHADAALIASWAGAGRESASTVDDLRRLCGEHETNRLASARRAELAAIEFFESCGMRVKDVSSGQISGNDLDWTTHDLIVGGEPYDVKNARRSYSSPRSFSELTVPRFKRARVATGVADVNILGVISHYLPPPGWAAPPSSHRPSILGAVSQKDIRDLREWAAGATNGALHIGHTESAPFLPGWFFEYPESAYAARRCAINRVSGIFSELARAKFDLSSVPLALRLVGNLPGETMFPEDAAGRMTKLHTTFGLTRFSFCLWALVELVRAAARDSEANPLLLHDLVFSRGDKLPRTLPALRYDPERYVDAMLDVVAAVWTHARNEITAFAEFQLAGTGVLRGRKVGGNWRTIVSYCGGIRVQPPLIRCGATPLVLGTQANCPACGRLVCDQCGYCSANCYEGLSRRQELSGMT